MKTAHIGIGSNLGSREDNCRTALKHLTDNGIIVIKPSSMIETAPWGVEDQPQFINMAVKTETVLEPEELLTVLQKIEVTMGRTRTVRWGPRIIDMDILFYDDVVMKTPELEIPHPHIQDRDFVLKPLAEIAPNLVHPVLKKSIIELLKELTK